MARRLLPPETFFEGTPPHVRAYIEQLHATIADLHTRIAELESKQAKNSAVLVETLCDSAIDTCLTKKGPISQSTNPNNQLGTLFRWTVG